MYIYLGNDKDTDSYTGNSSKGFYFWGMQVESFGENNCDGTIASSSSYIPTTSSTVTRQRDILKLNLNKIVNEKNIFNYNKFSIMSNLRFCDYLLISQTSKKYKDVCSLTENLNFTNYESQNAIFPLRKWNDGKISFYWNKANHNLDWMAKDNVNLKKMNYETTYLLNITDNDINLLDYDINKWLTLRKYNNYAINYLTINALGGYQSQYLKKLIIWNKKVNDKKYLYF